MQHLANERQGAPARKQHSLGRGGERPARGDSGSRARGTQAALTAPHGGRRREPRLGSGQRRRHCCSPLEHSILVLLVRRERLFQELDLGKAELGHIDGALILEESGRGGHDPRFAGGGVRRARRSRGRRQAARDWRARSARHCSRAEPRGGGLAGCAPRQRLPPCPARSAPAVRVMAAHFVERLLVLVRDPSCHGAVLEKGEPASGDKAGCAKSRSLVAVHQLVASRLVRLPWPRRHAQWHRLRD